MIHSIRSASFAWWSLAALTLGLLSSYFLRSPKLLPRLTGGLFVVTALMQLYGLRDGEFLVWAGIPAGAALLLIAWKLLRRLKRPPAPVALLLFLVFLGAGSLHAQVKLVRRYTTREPRDPKVLFAMAVTPDQDVLSFVAKKDGNWRLTRIRNWFEKNPGDETMDVPGIPVVSKSSSPVGLRSDLLVSPNGVFAVAIATAVWGNNRPVDNVVSAISFRAFRVVTSVHLDGIYTHFVDNQRRLVLQETSDPNHRPIVSNQTRTRGINLKFFTLPELAADGSCQFTESLSGRAWIPHDLDRGPSLQDLLGGLSPVRSSSLPTGPPCVPAGVSRDGEYRSESCNDFHRTLWGNPSVIDLHENVYSAKTGALIGTIKETTRNSINSRFAEHNGRDYLLILEGGTQLKVYEIAESIHGPRYRKAP